MTDEDELRQLYDDMYAAMVAKDELELRRVHADSFVLVHMTGMRMDKEEYIRAIMDGTLNYYSAQVEGLEIRVSGNNASIDGKSLVNAAVFGGGRHTWRLRLSLRAEKVGDAWKLTSAQASTY